MNIDYGTFDPATGTYKLADGEAYKPDEPAPVEDTTPKDGPPLKAVMQACGIMAIPCLLALVAKWFIL